MKCRFIAVWALSLLVLPHAWADSSQDALNSADLSAPSKVEKYEQTKTLKGKVISLQPHKDDTLNTPFYQLKLKTDNREVNVDLGPKYFPKDNHSINAGDDVVVFGVTFTGSDNKYRAKDVKRADSIDLIDKERLRKKR